MTLPRLPFPPSRLNVWAIEPTAAQLAWGELPAGPVSVSARSDGTVAAHASCEHPGGPGVLDLDGLRPGTEYRLEISAAAETTERTITTLRPPPGAELYRFATISDLHLGSDHFGFFKRMRDNGGHEEPFALRSAQSAVDAALAWGASELVIKGDAAHHSRAADFEMIGELVDRFPELPISLLPGNHDVDLRETALPERVGNRGVPFITGVTHLDRPGVRIVLGDTTVNGVGKGTLERVGNELIDTAASSDRAVTMLVHQQLQLRDPVRYWPPGIPGHEANHFLDRLATVRPDAVISSGHTHRNRVRRHASSAGGLLITEVAATHHWPGVWAGYVVYESGITQVVRRIGADVIGWHEYSKNAVLSVWQHYATGRMGDRCISHRWVNDSSGRG